MRAPCLAVCLILALPATGRASVYFFFSNVGSDVVLTGSGTVNLAGLTLNSNPNLVGGINPGIGVISAGPTASSAASYYSGITGPSTFGPGGGGFIPANSGTGNRYGVVGSSNLLAVPQGYTTGTPLSSTDTWTGTTILGMGLTPGTYTWTWGTGPTADSLVLFVPVPEPLTVGLAAAGGLLAVRGLRRRLTQT